ncbi:MAG: hypothetical protein JO219_03385 [Candidatus Eremiobacteraeota bacterium]|nr:hypothetical protein [Candidatus Eremiobacteraeota bacterium]MBV8366001.1 hypothetical protein [Candidatus Eremiobacteraeota bacterium]
MPIVLQVLLGLVLLVIASDAFANAVEWVGVMFRLTRSAVGAVVAAIGSSLPETMVAFIALVVIGSQTSTEIGIGAVVGAPLLLSTIAFAVVGAGALAFGKKHDTVHAPAPPVIVGLSLFCLAFAAVIGASFFPILPVRIAAAGFAVGAYVAYLAYHLRLRAVEGDEAPPRLRIAPWLAQPTPSLVLVQLLVATAITMLAARWFIGSLGALATLTSLSPLVISLLLSPIATELPELINGLLWMQRDLDDLALGNVLGAMMFQASIACAIGLIASPWHLDANSYRAAALTLASALFVLIWTALRKRVQALPLVLCVLFYVAYVVLELRAR